MNQSFRKIFYLTTILAVLLMSAVPSYTVYADDGAEGDSPQEVSPVTEPADPPAEQPPITGSANPPAEEPSTAEPANPPAEQPPDTEPANPPAEQPPITEPADPPAEEAPATKPADPPAEEAHATEPADPPAEESSVPASVEPAKEGDPVEPPLKEDSSAEEPASLPEILEQVPEGTDLVVVNEEGDPEPLASEAAAEILVKGDPIWCPAGVAPDSTNPNCTSSHTGFDDLIAELTVGGFNGDGVIWVESTYDATEDSGDITFNSSTLSSLGSLSVQGGWDGIAGSTSVDPNNPSILDDRMDFVDWTGNVSISNLYFNNPAGGTSLVVMTDGDISLENVTVDGSAAGSGAYLDNCDESGGACTDSGTISVNNSNFINNSDHGLNIRSSETVTIKNVTVDNNRQHGIQVNTNNEAGADVTIKDTTATRNIRDGIITSDVGGDLNLKGITANDNNSAGIRLRFPQGAVNGADITASSNRTNGIFILDTQGNISITGLTVNGNEREGIEIDNTRGDVVLSNITANDSATSDGVDIHNTNGNVKLTGITANNNNQVGIEVVLVDGSLGLNCVQTSENDGDGIFVQIDHDFYLKCSQSTDNNGDGLQIVDAPTAQLLSFISTGNGLLDINYDPLVTTLKEKQVDCSGKTTKSKSKSKPDHDDGLYTELYCLPGEIKVALYDTYGDMIEFDNLCGYEAGVFDPNSWEYPETIPGGGDDYLTSLQNKMVEEIPNLELNTEYGMPGVLAQILDELPFMLPDGYSYASAFFTAVLDEGEYLDPLPEESGLTVRFRVPEWLDPDEALTILWWDGADWVNLGGEFSEDGYYFQVTTEETGVFVLATIETES